MAAIYTVDQALQVDDYYSKVIKAARYKNVIQAILKRGEKPKQWKQEIEIEAAPTATDLAAPEGGDFDESNLAKRVNGVLEVQLQKFRSKKGFMVTDESKEMPGWTEKVGEAQLARQQRRDAEELAFSIDCALGSIQEAVARGTATDTVARTRGMMAWLQPNTAHSVQPIPSNLRPQAGIGADVTSATYFNEDLFKAELVKAALEGGDEHLQLTGLVGLKLKTLMSGWLGKATTVSGMDTVIRRNEPKSRKIELICDEFAYDGVSVRTLLCNHMGCTVSGGNDVAIGAVQYYSGAFIRPENWTIDTLVPLRKRMLPNRGGGERGFHEAILRLACRNPLAQFRVLHVPVG
jgi:hypothetical protein